MSLTSDELNLCAACICNPRFSDWIEKHGRKGTCDFAKNHESNHNIVTLAEFAEEVDRYFRENYQLGKQEPYIEGDADNVSYQQSGEPYVDILANDLECNPDIIEAIDQALPDCSHRDIAQGAEPFYDDQANYESKESAREREWIEERDHWYERRFNYQWSEFCEQVQYQRRFFKLKELLDDLFGAPEEYEKGTIRPIYNLTRGQSIYRARQLDDALTETLLRANSIKELGPPPKVKTPSGRMNVEFIPAFYAAFSEYTAVTEIRPSIGDKVAIGQFALQNDIRVFDFTAFSTRGEENDRTSSYAHTRYEFITQLEHEISKRISLFARQREYIPTQIVAEYLKEYFACEAVVYKSSMSGTRLHDNRNIVILNKGVDFEGNSDWSMLRLIEYKLKEIRDVSYEIVEPFDGF
jgi:hypothetical protein